MVAVIWCDVVNICGVVVVLVVAHVPAALVRATLVSSRFVVKKSSLMC